MTDHPYPFDANGLLASPYGTKISEAQQDARRRRDAERIAAAVKAREEAEARFADEQQQLVREDGRKRLEAYRQRCETRWQDNGGTPAGFASAWPALRDKWLADQLTNQERATVEDVARLRANPIYQV
jgi:hypothetical protein